MTERELLQAGFRYALSLRPIREDAEDLVQEACFRLYRNSGGIRAKALLFTTIRNLYIDQHRREKLLLFEPLDETTTAAPDGFTVDAELRAAELAKPLAALRDAEREALFLNVVEGYTAQEIADLTQRPRGTILSLVHRAKGKLYRALTDNSAEANAGQQASPAGGYHNAKT